MSNEQLRADILASWSRVSSFQEQSALLNRCYVALGEQQSAPAGLQALHPLCRARLQAEGKAYPRSGCEVCGKWSPKSAECMKQLAAAPKAEPVQGEK